jgi:glycosyltransferase involved in cell wall biosynthesis
MDDFAEQEQVQVHAVEMPRRITPLKDVVALGQTFHTIRKIRPHIVHSHTPKGGLLGMVAAWMARVPVRIYHIHGLPCMTAKGYKRILLTWSERVSCLCAHQVLCVSDSIREVAVNGKLCPGSKIKVLHHGSINGVDAESRFNPARLGDTVRDEWREKFGIPKTALVIGYVGRIVHDKGLVELNGAWKQLREEFPDLRLMLVGLFEAQDPLPRETEQALRTDESVILTGPVRDMPSAYMAMDIVVLPSYREGFGIVALETAAMGLPIVASRIPGIADAVDDGVTGTLVPVHDTQALAEALRVYIDNPDLRLQHGKAARERVLQDYRQEDYWKAHYDEYRRLLNTG